LTKRKKISGDLIEILRGEFIKRRRGTTREKRKKREKMIKKEEKIFREGGGEEIIFPLKEKNIGHAEKRDISVQNVVGKGETRFS